MFGVLRTVIFAVLIMHVIKEMKKDNKVKDHAILRKTMTEEELARDVREIDYHNYMNGYLASIRVK
jgi:hypothetical protein